MSPESVRFAGPRLAVVGVLAGVAIALGLPWIVLTYGQALGPGVLTLIIIAALVIGGLIALTAAFFGAVMPSVVESKKEKARFDVEVEAGKSGKEKQLQKS